MSGNLRRAIACAVAVMLSGCGGSPITRERIENALSHTFANLAHTQVSWLGMAPMAASEFAVKARCKKLLAGSASGAGEWVCTLTWQGPDRRQLRDTYELFVATDGCYTATIEGESLGGPTLRTPDGREVKNLLHTFEGCFNTM